MSRRRPGAWRWACQQLVLRVVCVLDVAAQCGWLRRMQVLGWAVVVENAAVPMVSVATGSGVGPTVVNGMMALLFGVLLGRASVYRWLRDRRAGREVPS